MNKHEYIRALREKYDNPELVRTIKHLEQKRDLAPHEIHVLSAMRKALKLEQREDDAQGSDQSPEDVACEVDGECSGAGDA